MLLLYDEGLEHHAADRCWRGRFRGSSRESAVAEPFFASMEASEKCR
jgi:hypothetical protein